jgi:hypothetical protein
MVIKHEMYKNIDILNKKVFMYPKLFFNIKFNIKI